MMLSYLYAKFFKRILRGKSIRNSCIDKTSVVNSGCNVCNVEMGKHSYCGYDCEIYDAKIGNYCSIAGQVHIGGSEHPISWVSTSPVFQDAGRSDPPKRFVKKDIPAPKKTIVGNDVWIGFGAIIKQGVTIGDGAVVASGAVVTKDVAPYSIVGGCPAKHIKFRFSENIINDMLAIKWWDLSDVDISKVAEYIDNPTEFIEMAKSIKIINK